MEPRIVVTRGDGRPLIEPEHVGEWLLEEPVESIEHIHEQTGEVVAVGVIAVDETAAALNVSPRTVKNDWTLARAWLYRALKRESE